ncbi:MAG: hypothetical protein PT119_07170 [Aphanizomenon gracile PMC627.10]|nr:hypothetical protein [Aphanizomenon gracile PMC627.10]
MSNLFTEVSVEQQAIVAGGNFSIPSLAFTTVNTAALAFGPGDAKAISAGVSIAKVTAPSAPRRRNGNRRGY